MSSMLFFVIQLAHEGLEKFGVLVDALLDVVQLGLVDQTDRCLDLEGLRLADLLTDELDRLRVPVHRLLHELHDDPVVDRQVRLLHIVERLDLVYGGHFARSHGHGEGDLEGLREALPLLPFPGTCPASFFAVFRRFIAA